MVELTAMNIQKDLSDEVFKKEDIIISGEGNIRNPQSIRKDKTGEK